jgi:hypothetical protein
MKLQSWDLFLKYIAQEYDIRGRLKETFLVRFAYENWRKPDKQVWDLAETPSLETYKKQMTSIYACFASDPQGCSELETQGKGPGKFNIVKDWLKDIKYPDWRVQNQVSASSVYASLNLQMPLSRDSPLYIARPPIEQDCRREILTPGALIRIKAPNKMGKTSLLRDILAHSQHQSCLTVYLNFQEAESAIFSTLDKFLRWFCANVSRGLNRQPQLEDYWAEDLYGSLMSCKAYFQGALLQPVAMPIVLGLDNVDRIFDYPQIAQDFLPMLRSWNEDANTVDLWQNFRLVLAHSTAVYIDLDVNQSPFNVGWPVQLPGFTAAQVTAFGRALGLDWLTIGVEVAEELVALVGGHPYLVRLAIDALLAQSASWSLLLAEAPTQGGIYGTHLRELWDALHRQPELVETMRTLVQSDHPLCLEPSQTYKLESMGLVTLTGDSVQPSCELYRRYFMAQL